MRRVLVGLILLFLLSTVLGAAEPFEFWPGTSYDPAVPTHKKLLGYEPGDRITTHAGIVRYLEALAAAAPARMKVFEYGRTWEERKLVYAIVGSEANIARLDEIQAGMGKLADPRRTAQAEADQLAESLPAPVWLAYGVHGNEISSPDAALLTAYHLLAAQGNGVVDKILKDALV
ncbi:MAG: peptidase M14, partial [bacterium]|nr:peptidase M14 [bacterium]